jgi:hypothetical protein
MLAARRTFIFLKYLYKLTLMFPILGIALGLIFAVIYSLNDSVQDSPQTALYIFWYRASLATTLIFSGMMIVGLKKPLELPDDEKSMLEDWCSFYDLFLCKSDNQLKWLVKVTLLVWPYILTLVGGMLLATIYYYMMIWWPHPLGPNIMHVYVYKIRVAIVLAGILPALQNYKYVRNYCQEWKS